MNLNCTDAERSQLEETYKGYLYHLIDRKEQLTVWEKDFCSNMANAIDQYGIGSLTRTQRLKLKDLKLMYN